MESSTTTELCMRLSLGKPPGYVSFSLVASIGDPIREFLKIIPIQSLIRTPIIPI